MQIFLCLASNFQCWKLDAKHNFFALAFLQSFQAWSSKALRHAECNFFMFGLKWSFRTLSSKTPRHANHKYFAFNLSWNTQAWSSRASKEAKANSLASTKLLRIVATPLLEECDDDTHSRNGDLGVLRDSRNFRVRWQGSKHLVLRRSSYHWKAIEV